MKNVELLLATPIGFALLLLVLGLVVALKLPRLSLMLLICAAAVPVMLSIPLIAFAIIKPLETRYPAITEAQTPSADVAVVLGGMLEQPVVPRVRFGLGPGADRILAASRLYKANKVKKIIISGGSFETSSKLKPEAYYAAELLEEWGVASKDIVLETASLSTNANASATAMLLDSLQANSSILITSAFHMPRSVASFTALDIQVYPYPVDYRVSGYHKPTLQKIVPTVDALTISSLAIHEYLGLIVYYFRGWI